jgi:predicted transcriptional regulator
LRISELGSDGKPIRGRTSKGQSRFSCISKDAYESIPWINGTVIEEFGNIKKMRVKTNYNMLSVTGILLALSRQKRTFSQLYAESSIRMKKRFLVYLDFCMERGFITKEMFRAGKHRFYYITEKGLQFLGLML